MISRKYTLLKAIEYLQEAERRRMWRRRKKFPRYEADEGWRMFWEKANQTSLQAFLMAHQIGEVKNVG